MIIKSIIRSIIRLIIRLILKNWVDTVLDCFGVRVDFIGVVTPIIRSRMGREWVENGVENGVENRLSDVVIQLHQGSPKANIQHNREYSKTLR